MNENIDDHEITWSHSKVGELITAYRNKPELWDNRHDDFYNRHKKLQAWSDISLQFNSDVESVRSKMMSLLSSFRREKRVKSKSTWFAYNYFQFLIDLKEENGSKKYKPEVQSTSDADFNEQEVSEMPVFRFDSPDNTLDQQEVTYNTVQLQHNSSKRTTRFDDKEEEYIVIKKHSKKDECYIFSKHIAMKLRQFSDTSRKIVMHRINSVIFEEETKEFNIVTSVDC